jgi:hypothetical protein
MVGAEPSYACLLLKCLIAWPRIQPVGVPLQSDPYLHRDAGRHSLLGRVSLQFNYRSLSPFTSGGAQHIGYDSSVPGLDFLLVFRGDTHLREALCKPPPDAVWFYGHGGVPRSRGIGSFRLALAHWGVSFRIPSIIDYRKQMRVINSLLISTVYNKHIIVDELAYCLQVRGSNRDKANIKIKSSPVQFMQGKRSLIVCI